MPTNYLAPKHAAIALGLSTSRLIQLEQQGELVSLRDSLGRRSYDPDVIERLRKKRATLRRTSGRQASGQFARE